MNRWSDRAAIVGYCGNVHPATNLIQLHENLDQKVARVRINLAKDQDPAGPAGAAAMPFGIWLSGSTLAELQSESARQDLRQRLRQLNLLPFTINGFPFGDFHQNVVKEKVYSPTWADSTRTQYTIDLARLHDQLLPPEATSSISTLPLGWPASGYAGTGRRTLKQKTSPEFLLACAQQLRQVARTLNRMHQDTGRKCIVCIEPEPGCVLDTAEDVCEFFQEYLFATEDRECCQTHLGVCHDVCHSAVMFESQAEAIGRYRSAGIQIGKIQISSALEVDFTAIDRPSVGDAFNELRQFSEPKYLHQTCIEDQDGQVNFYRDLDQALQENPQPTGCWRVHFHVPIFAADVGLLGTTQRMIRQCLNAVADDETINHFEIETYAWNVLPDLHRPESIVAGIAQEIRWFNQLTR